MSSRTLRSRVPSLLLTKVRKPRAMRAAVSCFETACALRQAGAAVQEQQLPSLFLCVSMLPSSLLARRRGSLTPWGADGESDLRRAEGPGQSQCRHLQGADRALCSHACVWRGHHRALLRYVSSGYIERLTHLCFCLASCCSSPFSADHLALPKA